MLYILGLVLGDCHTSNLHNNPRSMVGIRVLEMQTIEVIDSKNSSENFGKTEEAGLERKQNGSVPGI